MLFGKAALILIAVIVVFWMIGRLGRDRTGSG
jgi:hypothetical protein